MLHTPPTSFVSCVLDAVPQIVWTAAADGACTYLNTAWYQFTGHARGSDIPSGWAKALHADDQDRVMRNWSEAAESGAEFECEFRLRAASGEYRWVFSKATPAVDDGRIVSWCGTCTDIHDRVLAENALKENQIRSHAILDIIPNVIWTSGADGLPNYVSKRWETFIGTKAEDATGASWLRFLHPDDIEGTLREWGSCLSSGDPFTVRYRVRMASGEYQWILSQAVAERNGAGEIVCWYGSCTDIHDQVLAEQELKQTECRLRRTLDHIPQMIWATLPDGHHDYYSPSWYEFTGADEGTTDGEGWNGMFHPDDQERAWALWRHSLSTGEPYEIRYRLRHRSGEYRWVLGRALPERDEQGEIVRWYGTCTDMHSQIVAEQTVQESEVLYRSVMEASADGIKIINLDGTLELINSSGISAMELEGWEGVCGKPWASLWPEASSERVTRAIEDAGSGQIVRFTSYRPTARGTPKWWDVVVTPMFDDDDKVIRLLSVSRDITSQREAAEQLRLASEHDAVTTLPNRRSFQAHLQAATIRAMESGRSVGLLLIDLDHFKNVNDTLGHSAGDHLLKVLGRRLGALAPENHFVARLGGDEFAVVLDGVANRSDLLLAGEAILKRLGGPMNYEGRVLSVGASIGGAMFPQDGQSAHELFKNADTALYALKASGRGGTRMFHSQMRADAQLVTSQLSLARHFVNEQSVIPHYQAKIDLGSGQVRSFEALMRLKHPSRGVLLPEMVAEAFKNYELASKIGALMQENVFAQMNKWLEANVAFGLVSVNAAPAEFLRDDFAENVLGRLQKHNVPAAFLEIEVTEHVFMDRGAEYVRRALTLLKAAGVRISLDDFGTGYSSLSHLRDFPVDLVKIDRSFVSKMLEEREFGAIVSAIIGLTHSLSMEVVAEGVETLEQEAFLREKGCTFAQGYRYGRAVPADEVPRVLKAPTKSRAA